ncbi:hypothetical protein EDE05_11443 [Neorhizobium sp. R1-B]|nr:hypothetical protein EDE05_11443 [Neorhizobium sp. R1-B]
MSEKESAQNTGLNCIGDAIAICVVCGAEFPKSARSSRAVCSDNCKRERGRRYSKAYHRDAMQIEARVLAMFGGRQPTYQDFLDLVQGRRHERD